MLSDRLNLALTRGLLVLPDEGRIGVFGPRKGEDLSILPKERVHVITRHYMDHAYFEALGYATSVLADGRYALAIIVLPKARDEARRMIAEAHDSTDGIVVIDGQKTDGVDGLLKEIARRGTIAESLSKAHGKLAIIENAEVDDWREIGEHLVEGRFETVPGVFSADAIDPGSRLLAEALPISLEGRVVDLGAGWGYLADAALARSGVTHLDLVEADHAAIALARRNIRDARAEFHWADARHFEPSEKADHVITNPPFHTGRAADTSLGQAFIRQAAAILKPRGTLWLVANRHLPYETTLRNAFSDIRVLDETRSYKLFQASSPRR